MRVGHFVLRALVVDNELDEGLTFDPSEDDAFVLLSDVSVRFTLTCLFLRGARAAGAIDKPHIVAYVERLHADEGLLLQWRKVKHLFVFLWRLVFDARRHVGQAHLVVLTLNVVSPRSEDHSPLVFCRFACDADDNDDDADQHDGRC